MPRNVRNFWIEVKVDGRKSQIATGPTGKDGGFYLRVLVRENGAISERVLAVEGRALSDGRLVLIATGPCKDKDEFIRVDSER